MAPLTRLARWPPGATPMATEVVGAGLKPAPTDGNAPRGSHPEDAEAGGLGRRRVEAGGERQPKHHARVGGVDDAVVPDARGGVIGVALTLVLGADRRFERFVVRGAPSAALRFGRLLAQ